MSTTRNQKKPPSPVLRGGRAPFSGAFGTAWTSSTTSATAAPPTKSTTKTNANPSSTITSNPSTNWRRSPTSSANEQIKGSSSSTTAPSREPPPHRSPVAGTSSGNPSPSSPQLPSSEGETLSNQSSAASSSTSATPTPFYMQEGPSASTSNSRLGMENGYALSPMYSLILEYNEERGGNLSTAMEVAWVLMQPNLNPTDITRKFGEGVDQFTSICVKEERLTRILRAVSELQTFLDRMADLIEERTHAFCIDPQDTMTTALKGCESRSQLDMAYKILGKRLRIAQQSVMKYEAEYQGGEVPLSPVSTVPELYSDHPWL